METRPEASRPSSIRESDSMQTETRILARLFKTPSHQGNYVLRGRLPDGRIVEVFCNQGKSRPEDPDFLLAEVAESEGEMDARKRRVQLE